MRDVLTFLAALLDTPTAWRSSRGSACRKLRLSRKESKRRSMAGMRAREEFNRATAQAFIEADPRRLAEYRRRNPT